MNRFIVSAALAAVVSLSSVGLAEPGSAVYGTLLGCALYRDGGTDAVFEHSSTGVRDEQSDVALILKNKTELVGHEFECGVEEGWLRCDEPEDADPVSGKTFSQRKIRNGIEVTIGADAPVNLDHC